MSSALSTVAFLGATGDCAGFCLANALKAGHQCVALARTPAKLTTSLQSKGVSEAALKNLDIVQGDIRDQKAVERALQVHGQVADIIVTAVGSVPKLEWSLTSPIGVVDSTLCGDGAEVLAAALSALQPSKTPQLVAVSTTGITQGKQPRDVPLPYVPLYHWLLHVPHIDKANMEATLRKASPGFIAVKPTLLFDGPSRGITKLRVGTNDQPALGYGIRRSEVGEWMYDSLIARQAKPGYLGKGISLTM